MSGEREQPQAQRQGGLASFLEAKKEQERARLETMTATELLDFIHAHENSSDQSIVDTLNSALDYLWVELNPGDQNHLNPGDKSDWELAVSVVDRLANLRHVPNFD